MDGRELQSVRGPGVFAEHCVRPQWSSTLEKKQLLFRWEDVSHATDERERETLKMSPYHSWGEPRRHTGLVEDE